jgi:hypothetical protein
MTSRLATAYLIELVLCLRQMFIGMERALLHQ